MYKVFITLTGESYFVDADEAEVRADTERLVEQLFALHKATALIANPELMEALDSETYWANMRESLHEFYTVELVVGVNAKAFADMVDLKCSLVDSYVELLAKKHEVEEMLGVQPKHHGSAIDALTAFFEDVEAADSNVAGKMRKRYKDGG